MQESNRVGNFILGADAFDSKASLNERKLQHCRDGARGTLDRLVAIINSPQLLQPNLSLRHIAQTVRECVNLSEPGPNVFILVLQYKDFTEEDRYRVKIILKEFSNDAFKHTIVLTTDEESYGSFLTSMIKNNAIKLLIQECGGRHLHFDGRKPEWQSDMFKVVDKILQENQEEFLTCETYENVKRTPMDEENLERSYHRDDGKPEEGQKEGSDEGRSKLLLFFCISKLLQSITHSLI